MKTTFTRFCSKHPQQKMTLLLTSYVCAACNPPKTFFQAAESQQNEDNLTLQIDHAALQGLTLDSQGRILCMCGSLLDSATPTVLTCIRGHVRNWSPWVGAKILWRGTELEWTEAPNGMGSCWQRK